MIVQNKYNSMECAHYITKKGEGGEMPKKKISVLFLIVQNKENQNALECASDIAKSSSCYFRSAEKLHLPKLWTVCSKSKPVGDWELLLEVEETLWKHHMDLIE